MMSKKTKEIWYTKYNGVNKRIVESEPYGDTYKVVAKNVFLSLSKCFDNIEDAIEQVEAEKTSKIKILEKQLYTLKNCKVLVNE